MEKTTNYQLNQWDANDKVQRVDFNADNAKIDAAIRAVDKKADTKADTTALNALSRRVDAAVADRLRMDVGSYVGTGEITRSLDLAQTLGKPVRAMIILANPYLIMTFPGTSTVATWYGDTSYGARNDEGRTYGYIAFG